MIKAQHGRVLFFAAIAVVVVVVGAPCARALYLDEAQNISFRARIYTQAGIRIENSSTDTIPSAAEGQLIQHRNFYNPELDAQLTPYLGFLRGGALDWLAPDDFRFRLAAWGFYDGIYDYGSGQFNRSQRLVNSSYPDLTKRTHAFFLEGSRYDPKGRTVDSIYPDHEVLNPRDIFAEQRRINELYLSYTKGPLFVRVGRQGISWGESDTIALLDQNNPFDVTLAAPGIFEDLDEARIPLWTVRASYKLFEVLGPLSSAFVEGYLVPGALDTNTGWFPILTASPYSPRGQDPQTLIPAGIPYQFVFLDRVPRKQMANNRWGVRTQALVNRYMTVSAWYYTHFPNQPVPLVRGLVPVPEPPPLPGQPIPQVFTTENVHKLTGVFGASASFFFEPFDGIVRLETEYFRHEPGFIPQKNMGITSQTKNNPFSLFTACTPDKNGKSACTLPKADFLRWEVGFDRFFFLRPLNPTNSFTIISALVGSYNLDETSKEDFRFAGQRKPGAQGTSPDDYVQLKKVEAFVQTALQTDYLHGRISPRLTTIFHSRGTVAVLPSVRYRWTDWLLFDLGLVYIGGCYQSFGFFRDRDQVTIRMTYQLN
jgi:hypothetical protein